MNANKNATNLSLQTDPEDPEIDDITPEEYEEAPELTDELLAQSTLMHGRQEIYSFPKELITLPLPRAAFDQWVATGPGWYERMAEHLRNI